MDIFSWEDALRLACFCGVLVLLVVAERVAPRRRLTTRQPLRWLSNLGLAGLNTVVVRLLMPTSALGMAVLAESRGWGLFNLVVLPAWLAVVLSVVVLDLAIYLQHVLFHAVPVLWRLHRVHHADLDFDVTTGVRFHTIEILLSMGIKMVLVILLGAPVLAVLIFEVLLNATSMFSHGNFRLPLGLDRLLRWVIVTPDMHRVHHSINPHETNSNFGFNLAWWDFLLGTYRPQPEKGHEEMVIGLEEFRQEENVERLHRMLALPFLGPKPRDSTLGKRG